jgi:hypothetical protein
MEQQRTSQITRKILLGTKAFVVRFFWNEKELSFQNKGTTHDTLGNTVEHHREQHPRQRGTTA